MVVKNMTVEEYVKEELGRAKKGLDKFTIGVNKEGILYWKGYYDGINWTKTKLDSFQEMWELKRRMDDAK